MNELSVLTRGGGRIFRLWSAAKSRGAVSYADWRDAKMAQMPRGPEELVVEIGGLGDVSPAQAQALPYRLRRANMAVYSCRDENVARAAVRAVAARFGLHRLDHHPCAGEGGVTVAPMHPHCMTIPANHEDGREIRPARRGPVFSFDPVTGALHMRYTARGKNVVWRNDPATLAAAAILNGLLGDDDGSARERHVYRARYFDRIQTMQ